MIRESDDVRKLEAEIAEDLALYFRESNPLDSMIIYIYDDRDTPVGSASRRPSTS